VIFGHSDKIIKTSDINRDSSFQKTAGYTSFEHKKNEEIWEELKEQVEQKQREHKSNWLHVTRMNDKDAKNNAELHSSVGIATGYGLNGPGIESRWGGEIFRTCPDRP